MNSSAHRAPCVLTIAGSDSGGNAGVQADLRAFHAYGLHGCTVLAALTAQNPRGVAAIHPVPADFVAAQLDAVLGVYDIRALKTGVLASPEVIEVVADRLAAHPEIAAVIDPVMVATSGARLIPDAAVDALTRRLLPLATLVTPNIPEAAVLGEVCSLQFAVCSGGQVAPRPFRGAQENRPASATANCKLQTANSESKNLPDSAFLARVLAERYGCAVLVKGGHDDGAESVDVLCDATGRVQTFSALRLLAPVSTHGTGCSLAAALAAELALGRDLAAAVAGAKRYVHEAIRTSYWVGDNCGVLGFVEVGSRSY